ncbi:MAG: hypothetical protein IPM24_17560 [Bryobacterales bacterium]|nr:hypothetical protein [Bryobacterales bacterium]
MSRAPRANAANSLFCWVALGLLLALPLRAQEEAGEPEQPAYSGPAVLSRSSGSILRLPRESVRFRPMFGVNGVYDTSFAAVSVDEQGNQIQQNLTGVEGTAGILGFRRFRRGNVSADYRGNYRRYNQSQLFNGSDHLFALGYTHQVNRQVQFSLRQTAGTFQRGFFFPMALGTVTPDETNIPRDEIFDSRVYYSDSSADVTVRLSARSSVNMGGDAFVVRRKASALFGVTGGGARADYSRRMTRNVTLGAQYNFNKFNFTNSFGATDLHTVALNYGHRLGRRTELALSAGGMRVELQSLRSVPVDPVLEAILGIRSGIEAFYNVNYLPYASIRLTQGYRQGSLTVSASSGVTPGNGLLLTARQQQFNTNYTYTGIRRWNFGFGLYYSEMSAVTQQIGPFTTYGGGSGASYALGQGLHLNSRVDYRKFTVGGESNFLRSGVRFTVGLSYAPGDFPLTLW